MFEQMKEDIQVVFERDPAAKTKVEVLLNYPGLHAIWIQRGITHKLYQKKHFVLARFISQGYFERHLNRLRRQNKGK